MKRLVCTLLIIALFATVPTRVQADTYTEYPSRVRINGDWGDTSIQLTDLSSNGTGSSSDPFIIEWCRFTGDPGGLHLINISYYVVIRNCVFQGSADDGLWIDRTMYVEVYDCEFYSVADFTSVDNSTIRDNNFTSCRLSVSESEHTNISSNIFTGAGSEFSMSNSHYIYFGFNYMFESSTSIRFHHGVSNGLFENNTILESTTGAQISDADYNVVRYNTIINCSYYGILLEEGCVGNIIHDNIVENVGLELPQFTLASDSHCGLYLVGNSRGNFITWNTFSGNAEAVIDNSGNTYAANYWSDYSGVDENEDGFGDTPYAVAGSSSSEDPHPRMTRGIVSYLIPQPTSTTMPTVPGPAPRETNFDIVIVLAAAVLVIVTTTLVGKRLVTKNE